MCCVARTLTSISDLTGFDGGDYFGDPGQVRAYFTVAVMERLSSRLVKPDRPDPS